jgi:hypothetical protein
MLSAKSDNRKALLLPFSQNESSINRRKGSGKSKRNLLLWNVQGFRRKAIRRIPYASRIFRYESQARTSGVHSFIQGGRNYCDDYRGYRS